MIFDRFDPLEEESSASFTGDTLLEMLEILRKGLYFLAEDDV